MPAKELADIEGAVLSETEKGVFFDDGNRRVWLPKSLVEWDPDSKTMTMPIWLAKDKERI